MKHAVLFMILNLWCLSGLPAQTSCPVIPLPLEAEPGTGTFVLSRKTPVTFNSGLIRETVAYFKAALLEKTGIPLAVEKITGKTPVITFELEEGDALAPDESYTLQVTTEGISVRAKTLAGMFNGTVSLLHLAFNSQTDGERIAVEAWNISDSPAYSWRGLMLDVSRYFIPKPKLLSLIDWMAFYKLNRLHLHLTDEPAWRLEIKKYPRLAEIGGQGDYNDPDKPARYYSQRDILQIVNYAASRNITVIPEIDMPGHATAANRAYPEYSGGGSEKHPEFTFNPGKEETYTYLGDILRETRALFPSGILHLGGDEVSFGNDKWLNDKGVLKKMQENGWKDVKQVELGFMRRMADTVLAMGARIAAWDELAETELPVDKTIIFWWRHDKPEQLYKALEKGYRTVICPRLPYYFDFVQDSTHRSGRTWNGKYNALYDVYSFSVRDLAKGADASKVLGVQANLWTETVTATERVDYLLFPRMAALSESAWTRDRKNFKDFTNRLNSHFRWYQQAGLYYYNPENPGETPEPVYPKKKN